jgi:hypothetical protein
VADSKTGKKSKGNSVEKPKKLPAELPEKFDTEQKQKDSPADKPKALAFMVQCNLAAHPFERVQRGRF